MKTLLLVLAVILGGIAAVSLLGCASQPDITKPVALFSVGDRVAFKKFMTVWDAKSKPETFWIDKGDTGVVIDINYFEYDVQYEIKLDKAKPNERLFVRVFERLVEAVYYPDPALSPGRK